jgi:hypothetical protein
MKELNIKNKMILAVDSDGTFLSILEREILEDYPECLVDTVTAFEQARQMIQMYTYDLVILDVEKEPGSKVVDLVSGRGCSTLLLTEDGTNSSSKVRQVVSGCKGVVPRDEICQVKPIIRQALEGGFLRRYKSYFWKLTRASGVGSLDTAVHNFIFY